MTASMRLEAPRVRRYQPGGQALPVALAAGLILVSGSPVLSGPLAPLVLVLLMMGALQLPPSRTGASFGGRYLLMAVVLAGVFIGQWSRFGFVSWPACAYFLVKLLAGGFVVHRIGRPFSLHFLQATYLLSVLAMIGYAAMLLLGNANIPALFPESLIGANLKSLFFITIHMTPEWWRNSGPMWEPGAYQGIINLALMMAPNRLLLARSYRWRVLVLLAALLTTFSTTGYIMLFLVVLYKILGSRSSGVLKLPLIGLVVGVAVFTYLEADFLGQKIAEQVANSASQEDFTPDRFGALLFDLHYIEKSPWIGNGFHEATRFADHPWLQGEPLGHGNGLSNFTASLGFVGVAVYFLGLASAGFARRPLDRIALVVLVAGLAFGEQFLLFPLFLGLPFLASPLPPSVRRRRRRRQPRPAVSASQDPQLWPTPTPTRA